MPLFVKHYGYGTSIVHKTPFEEYIAKMVSPDPYDSGALEYVTEKVERLSKLVGVLVALLYGQGTLANDDIKALADCISPNCPFIVVEGD